jgi:hypothetical protein
VEKNCDISFTAQQISSKCNGLVPLFKSLANSGSYLFLVQLPRPESPKFLSTDIYFDTVIFVLVRRY